MFRDERSDFLSFLALWEFFATQLAEKLSHRRLVDACRARFVSYLRLTEWRDVHAQLASEMAEQGWKWDAKLPAAIDAARYRSIHDALLAGLLGNVGMKDAEGDGYLGARGIRFYLHPGVGAREEGAEMGARGRARRDFAAVRALRGESRAGMDRGGRRRSCHPRVLRAALGRGAWRGRRKRARVCCSG